jgi:hypothetical protein
MSSVMITLGLSDGGLLYGGLSDGVVIKSERIDAILPQDLWSNVEFHRMRLIENPLLSKSAWITAMAPLKLLPSQKRTLPLGRMSVLMDTEETVETVEDVLVKTTRTEVGLRDSNESVTVLPPSSWTTELATKGSGP